MLQFNCQYRYPDGFNVDIEMQLENGCTALFGPSGSGKTTVLSLIAGLIVPDKGSIIVDGVTISDSESGIQTPVHQRGVGMVMQTPQLFPHMTVRKNLEFGQRARKAGFHEIDFEQLIDVLAIRPLLDRLPATLSGGEKSRVALGRALASRPRFLLMDEPLASLDEGIKHQVLDYLHEVISRWQVPTVFVTHNRVEAARIADRVVHVSAGRVVDAVESGLSASPHDSERTID